MNYTLTIWKTLEDLLIELRKKNVQIPVNVLEDLRAAKSLIELSYNTAAPMETVAKTQTYLTNVEAYLISQAQKVFEPTVVDSWLKRLKEQNLQNDKETNTSENRFIVGVPRGQQWIRIETGDKLPEEHILKLAKEWHCTVNKQTDGRLMVYGQLDAVKEFVKQIAAKTA
jgi:hypothetical protein